MFKFYMDESGTHDASPVTTVAVYYARPSVWQDWTKKWNRQKHPINIVHAVDCANLKNEFKGWSKESCDNFSKNLLPVIANADIYGHVVGIDNRDLAKCLKDYPKVVDNIGSQYLICFQLAIQKIFIDFDRQGIGSRVTVVHETNDYKQDVLSCFDWLKKHPANSNRRLSIKFATKHEAVPLQAADILAYEGNKRIRNIDGKERRSWRALNPDRNRVGLDFFNEKAIREWFLALERRGATLR